MAAEKETKNDEETETEHFKGVYDEDVIQSKSSKKLGVVIKTCRDDSSDEDSDDSDDEEMEKVEPGKVMVVWYNRKSKWNDNDTNIIDESAVQLVDRSLLPGDVIRWVDGKKSKQKGQITNVSVLVDCHIVGTNHVLKNINANQLSPLLRYVSGTPVVKGPWLGIIKAVLMELTLRLKNGSRCILSGDVINNIYDITDQRDEDSPYYCPDFYPGQQVQSTARVFKDALWIFGSKPAVSNQGRLNAVVEDVVVDGLDVDWQVCGYTGSFEGSLVQPDPIIKRAELSNNDLKVLEHFKNAHTQIGDKAFYILKDSDVQLCKEFAPKKKKEKTEHHETCESAASALGASNEDDGEDSDLETEPVSKHTASVTNSRQVGSRPRRRRHMPIQKKKKRYQPPVLMVAGEKVCVEICNTRTYANTIWQDGTIQENVVSTELYPIIHLDELEFFPGDFVVDTRVDSAHQHDLGVIQSADFEARLCTIRWMDGWMQLYGTNSSSSIQRGDADIEEGVSVYEIKDFEDYEVRAGDFVVRLSPKDDNLAEKTIVAPAGQVLKVNTNGTVQVRWVDTTISSVLPSELYVLNEEDVEWGSGGEATGSTDEWEGEDEWETASETSDVPNASAADLGVAINSLNARIAVANETAGQLINDFQNEAVESINDLGNAMGSLNAQITGMNERTVHFINALGDQFLPHAWEGALQPSDSEHPPGESAVRESRENIVEIDAFTTHDSVSGNNLDAPITISAENTIKSNSADDCEKNAEKNAGKVHISSGASSEAMEHTMKTESTSDLTKVETCNEKALQHKDASNNSESDKDTHSTNTGSFLSIENTLPCHKFFNQIAKPHNAWSFNSAVMRDVKLLKYHLPLGITVKSFEDRIDLFSALIRGSPGTPYEDGLFYFDIQLPDNYPAFPPKVHYHAFCSSRLNPNLYEEGKVCVSLLGTWSGTGSEKWTSKSTMQQLLVSIQGLILNEEPYFNEAGYEKHRNTPEGTENSRMYNEMAVIKMLQSIQLMITRPPDIFKEEVAAHFKERLPILLKRFDAWLESDGTANDYNNAIIPSYPLFPLSKGFCTTVSRVIDNLRRKLLEAPFT